MLISSLEGRAKVYGQTERGDHGRICLGSATERGHKQTARGHVRKALTNATKASTNEYYEFWKALRV